MSDHRDNTPDKEAPDWYTERLQQLKERTRQLEQEKALKARLGPWQLIDTLTESDDLILACRASDGAQMIWRASFLLRNLRGPTPYHLGFKATHWMRLPAPPNTTHKHPVTLPKPENNGWQPLSTFPEDRYDKVEVGWWHDNEWHSHIAEKLRGGPWITTGNRAIATPDWWRELTPPPMPPGVK